ncbi:MAG: hypothetical protein OK456_08205 [Thaumarchaeota archaeon]|nr:hypothetical protein [Nitrososphaerota archaeon]
MKLQGRVALPLSAITVFLLVALCYLPSASAQANTTSTATVSTGTNIPPPTGCIAPGYRAPASLITTLGSNKSVSEGFTLGTPTKADKPYEYLFIAGGGLLALLILIGIIWAIALVVRRASRRKSQDLSPSAKKSHAFRNVYLSFLLIALVATGAAAYQLSPYLIPHERVDSVPNGVVQNIASPYNPIQLNPLSTKYYFEPAYVNNESTLLEGNFTVTSGSPVIAVVIPDSLRASWFADLENGTFTGATGCTMGGLPVYYNSGPAASGAFAVEIPPVTSQATYDVIFANPSGNQTVTLAANVFWAY